MGELRHPGGELLRGNEAEAVTGLLGGGEDVADIAEAVVAGDHRTRRAVAVGVGQRLRHVKD